MRTTSQHSPSQRLVILNQLLQCVSLTRLRRVGSVSQLHVRRPFTPHCMPPALQGIHALLPPSHPLSSSPTAPRSLPRIHPPPLSFIRLQAGVSHRLWSHAGREGDVRLKGQSLPSNFLALECNLGGDFPRLTCDTRERVMEGRRESSPGLKGHQ